MCVGRRQPHAPTVWYRIETLKFSWSFYSHFCPFLFFCLSVLMKERWCHTYGEVGLLCWRLVQAVKRSKGEVMNPTTVEHLFLSDNQLPVCSYVFVKQQAKQNNKSGWETNKQTSLPNPLTSRSQSLEIFSYSQKSHVRCSTNAPCS